ncbi:MAG: PAC2 family protein [Acidimicrobiaceae bacterium]|nr:PAC2 family protein [Acidimicrobiaceae bacterium]
MSHEVLTTAFEALGPLNRPIMVLALRGLFDIAEVATDAIDALAENRIAPIVASIDPDPFYDFTQERPQVEFDDDEERVILWPENEFRVARFPGGAHDLVLLAGVEPHLRYATFADAIIRVARELSCEMVVTLGAAPEAIPHSRPAHVVGSSTNDGLVRALGLSRPQYQGVTGLVGVLQERLDRAGIPAVSLRVGVPHYLGNAKHPQSSAALLQHLEHVLGVPTGHGMLAEDAMRWRGLHDEAVAEDDQAAPYVMMLEHEYDRRMEAALPSGDDLAAELEKFLRDQRDEPGDGPAE